MTVEFGTDNKLLWTLLSKEQVPEYIEFLEKEIKGLGEDIKDTQTRIDDVKLFFGVE